MNNSLFYIQEFGSAKDQFKFQSKVENTFHKNGYQAIAFPKNSFFKKILFLVSSFLFLKPKSIILFQYPIFSKLNLVLLKLLRYKNIKSVCIVTDLDSIRDSKNIEEEFRKLNNFNHFIVQNEAMLLLFQSKLINKNYSVIHFFDIHFYPPFSERRLSNKIAFSGNVAKAPFVFQLNNIKDIIWNIYSQATANVKGNTYFYYINNQQTDKTFLDASFGLVWDGEFVDSISCPKGIYLKYVSPLKLSKYILAGLPIIIHEEAAVANFVLTNNIGFCIRSLHEIKERINGISEHEYFLMIENLKPIAEKIKSGDYLLTSVNQIIQK